MNGMTEAQVSERKPIAKNGAVLAPGERRQRPAPNGHSLPVGRPKGVPNKLTQTLKEAVEKAARDCHPQGLAGWLVERAQGGVQDRQIFAGLVGKVIPIQVNQQVNGGISINLNWLGGRAIGTVSAQPKVIDAQTVELIEDSGARRWIGDANPDAGQVPEPVGAAQAPSGYPGTSEPAIAQPEPIQGHGGGVFDSSRPPTPHPPSNPAVGV